MSTESQSSISSDYFQQPKNVEGSAGGRNVLVLNNGKTSRIAERKYFDSVSINTTYNILYIYNPPEVSRGRR